MEPLASSLEGFVENYGYWAILAGTVLEGETVLILGGLAAHQGYLELAWVLLAGAAGAFCGDQMFFFLGRRHSGKILARFPSLQTRVDKAHRKVERFHTSFIMIYRFMYGFRSVTPFVLGTSHIPTRRFVILNILAVLLWAFLVGTGGYLFGNALETVLGKYKGRFLGVVVATAISAWVIWWFARKKAKPCRCGAPNCKCA
jgi:membrane protein DedA with SNARE-associated domain